MSCIYFPDCFTAEDCVQFLRERGHDFNKPLSWSLYGDKFAWAYLLD